MKVRGRGGTVSVVVVGFAVCVAGLAWAMDASGGSRRADEAADLAGVWGLPIGLVGSVLTALSSWAALRALRNQRTGEVVADDLARFVVREEGAQYRQLLGSGPAAPDGRLDLSFSTVATGARNTPPDGTLEGIVEYYRSLRPGRLIITGCSAPGPTGATDGDAGTGKTVLALALLLGLAKERVSGEPVPVRLVAASWPGSEIRDWLKAHLVATYRLAARDAALLVDSNLVLPVIDGLDEMDSCTSPGYTSRAATLLRAVERFEDGGTHCPVIVTCRHGHYQALVDADVQPNIAAHIVLNRVDAFRAGDYLRQRVAVTESGRARWQSVLCALDVVAEWGEENAAPSAARLAGMLDTPWRLTLAVTVFEERSADGQHLRDPADLLSYVAEGRLYSYLLEHYIGAAVAVPRDDVGNAAGDSSSGVRARLDATAAGRYLATLAGYLNANAGIDGGRPRTIKGRVLSSSDLVLHELWPLAHPRRVQWVERALVALLTLAFPAMLLIFFHTDMHILRPFLILLLASVLFAVMYRPTWPVTHQVDFRRLRTRRGQCAAAVGFFLCNVFCVMVFYAINRDWDLAFESGIAAGLVLGPTFGLVVGKRSPGTGPRDLVRRDFTTAVVPALLLLIVPSAYMGSLLVRTYFYGYVGVSLGGFGDLLWFLSLCGFAVSAGLFMFGIPIGGGVGALRYVTFLLCARGRLPWRLGRFLQACYEVGILRVAGTAWQFRHRELQDHLARRITRGT